MKKQIRSNVSFDSEIFNKSLVIIPALNEELNIGTIVSNLLEKFPGIDVVVINDCSTDQTQDVAADAGAIVLNHSNQMGYGVALQTGYKYILESDKYEYIVQMDGDGQHHIEDVPKLLLSLLESKVDLVIGSRFLNSESGYQVPWIRRMGIRFFGVLVYLFTKKKMKDVTSGFQAFSKKILNHFVSDDFPSYYPDANVIILLLKNGFNIEEVACTMSENQEGKSMHKGLSQQIYYVITMLLSIMVIVLKGVKKKNEH